MVTLSIVVPTYKRPDDLRKFLNCVRPQVAFRPDRHLIVVNDGAHDSAYQAVLDEQDDWFTYLPKPKNEGPAAARNHAARHARGDFIVFTDDDCRPRPHWLDYIQAALETQPWLDGVAGYTDPHFGNPDSLREWLIARSNILPGAIHDDLGRLICAVTAALAVRRDWFERVDGFDETFRPAGEDLDLTQRLIKAGAVIEADGRWRTGHTTTDTIRAYVRRFYAYGQGSARYAMTRADWTHPDLRHYLERSARERSASGWTVALKYQEAWKTAGAFRRFALWAFVWLVARRYAQGFADGAKRFRRADAPPPSQQWMFWPRLGYAVDGLPRR
jgi:glycosyltransferase involved in cell wall biosynthesis